MSERPLNALTIDVEEYFQVHNLEGRVRRGEWDNYESRVEPSTEKVLSILGETGTSATFFVLGWIAERHPGLVRRIGAAGHEVAVHGYDHRLIYDQTPEEFRDDVSRTKDIVEGVIGKEVAGYRAPAFSITDRSLWALDVLEECGMRYDASICPGRAFNHDRYGILDARREPHLIRSGLWELPVTVVRWLGQDFPLGGGWLRLYPYWLTARSLKQMNVEEKQAVIYLHQWELDPEQPRINVGPWRRFRHYNNLHKTADRLRALCRDFSFGTVAQVLDL